MFCIQIAKVKVQSLIPFKLICKLDHQFHLKLTSNRTQSMDVIGLFFGTIFGPILLIVGHNHITKNIAKDTTLVSALT